MTRISVAVALVVLAIALPASAQKPAGSLRGAWRVASLTTADGKTDSAPQPGLYIFTDRHYGIQRVTTARAALPAQNASDKDRLAAFDPFIANTGTYELQGNTLITRPIVAKNPNVMTGPPQKSDVKFEGASTLQLVSTGPDGTKTTYKLQRVE
jgi:hypothetical protein